MNTRVVIAKWSIVLCLILSPIFFYALISAMKCISSCRESDSVLLIYCLVILCPLLTISGANFLVQWLTGGWDNLISWEKYFLYAVPYCLLAMSLIALGYLIYYFQIFIILFFIIVLIGYFFYREIFTKKKLP